MDLTRGLDPDLDLRLGSRPFLWSHRLEFHVLSLGFLALRSRRWVGLWFLGVKHPTFQLATLGHTEPHAHEGSLQPKYTPDGTPVEMLAFRGLRCEVADLVSHTSRSRVPATSNAPSPISNPQHPIIPPISLPTLSEYLNGGTRALICFPDQECKPR